MKIIQTNKWNSRRFGSRDYLAVRRMEKKRAALQVVLDDILATIPVHDWRYLVALSKQLVINNGLLKGILEDKATGVVGDAFDPEFLGRNETWGEQAKTWLETEFYPKAELRGILDFRDIQFQKSTNMDACGDVFRLLTKKRDGSPAIQLIQAHRVGQRDLGNQIIGGDYDSYRIENGIVMDPETGEVVGYNVLGDQASEDRIYSTAYMTHLIDPIFADQIRGLPAAIAGLRALVMSEKTDENEEDFVEMVSRIFLIEKNPQGVAGPDFGGGDPEGEESEDGETTKDPKAPNMLDLWEGLAKIFKSGTDSGLEAFSPGDRPTEAFAAHRDSRYRMVCVGIGWPYELSWKLGELTSVGVHSVEQKARRTITDRQSKIVPSAVEEIRFAIAVAMDRGDLPFNEDWRMWGVSLPPRYSLNPSKDAESRRRDLELGLTTVGRVLKAEGFKGGPKALFRERAVEIADKKDIRDEVSKKRNQPIEDWEMGRPPQGMAAPTETPNPKDPNE